MIYDANIARRRAWRSDDRQRLAEILAAHINFYDDDIADAPEAILAEFRRTWVIRHRDELDLLGFHCGIREIPADPMNFYPQIWEMGYQSGWCRAGWSFDPDDCTPQLPVIVLWDTDIDQSDITEEPTE